MVISLVPIGPDMVEVGGYVEVADDGKNIKGAEEGYEG